MDDDFGKRALKEYRVLASQIHEAQIALKELQPRLDKVAAVIQAYGLEGVLDQVEPGDDPKSSTDFARNKSQQIVSEAEKFLRENGNHWMRSSEIYLHLVGVGISIGGKNPNATLSAHLSNSKRFDSDRARGWRIRQKFMQVGSSDDLKTATPWWNRRFKIE